MARTAGEEGIAMTTRAEIHDATAFDTGDEFASERQVREYFTVANIEAMIGTCPQTQAALDAMADAVIEHRWHCAF